MPILVLKGVFQISQDIYKLSAFEIFFFPPKNHGEKSPPTPQMLCHIMYLSFGLADKAPSLAVPTEAGLGYPIRTLAVSPGGTACEGVTQE